MKDMYASTLSPALDIGVGCYLLVVAVLSIMGNLLVLIMAYKRSSRMKPPELLSVNLALTDLGAAVTMYPMAVASAWSHRWLGGDAACVYYGLVGFFFGVASIMNLTILAVVRLIVSLSLQSPSLNVVNALIGTWDYYEPDCFANKATYHVSCHEKISRKRVKILCIWSWLYALVWALFPLLGWGRYGPEPFGLSCSLAWGEMKHEGFSFVMSMFSFNLAAPTVVIIGCYFGIAVKLYVIYKKAVNNPVPNIIKLHRRLLVIAALISAGFIFCWAPYGMVSLWSIYHDSSSIPPEVSLLPCMFAKSSTLYNPLIYYIFSQSFKSEVRQLREKICLRYNKCHITNPINDNAIYMVSGSIQPKMAARPALQETTAVNITTEG